mmetsp:Transcript_22742/g.67019  ORF Transcript_22742/g.67019 Transcript_22742/m.67019 type:complete len:221 (+) Transcript_22742:642-1304(+)
MVCEWRCPAGWEPQQRRQASSRASPTARCTWLLGFLARRSTRRSRAPWTQPVITIPTHRQRSARERGPSILLSSWIPLRRARGTAWRTPRPSSPDSPNTPRQAGSARRHASACWAWTCACACSRHHDASHALPSSPWTASALTAPRTSRGAWTTWNVSSAGSQPPATYTGAARPIRKAGSAWTCKISGATSRASSSSPTGATAWARPPPCLDGSRGWARR